MITPDIDSVMPGAGTVPNTVVVPTRVGQLENDTGFVTDSALQEVAQKAAKGEKALQPDEAVQQFASMAQGRLADSALQPGAMDGYVRRQELADALANVGSAEDAEKARTALQPMDLEAYVTRLMLVERLTAFASGLASASQGELAETAVQPDELAAYVTNTALAGVLQGLATASQGARADSALQPGSLDSLATKASLDQFATKTALVEAIQGTATAQQGTKADTAVQPSSLQAYARTDSLAQYATTAALAQAVAGRATSAQGAAADTALQPPGTPLARALAFATAYQADQKGKAALLSIMLRMSYTVTVAGLMSDEVELRIGPDASVATGGGFRIATAEGGVTGIALIIGTTVVTRPQVVAMIPPGWWFAVRRVSGNGATIHSAFIQPFG